MAVANNLFMDKFFVFSRLVVSPLFLPVALAVSSTAAGMFRSRLNTSR
ncbi:hypothetical protein SAMN05444172_8952 [Burkholderia sp. GAS332]|nr:hypothetical protein SAMN05444172_8952 [Burkholderia sp. GAS332]